MRFRLALLTLGVTISAGLLLSVKAAYPSHRHGPTVQLTATVSDTAGGVLSYHWRATDGTINDVNSTSTTWTLPTGPGLHFAYLLASNGFGGYTERRVAVNTDTIGVENESENGWVPMIAPPALPQSGDYYRATLGFGLSAAATSDTNTVPPGQFPATVNATNLDVFLYDPTLNQRYPPAALFTLMAAVRSSFLASSPMSTISISTVPRMAASRSYLADQIS